VWFVLRMRFPNLDILLRRTSVPKLADLGGPLGICLALGTLPFVRPELVRLRIFRPMLGAMPLFGFLRIPNRRSFPGEVLRLAGFVSKEGTALGAEEPGFFRPEWCMK
jgi:hypothetical protein